MVRLGLSIYLTFATLAGPLLCPCSASQIFSLVSPPNLEARPDSNSSCPCCPKLRNLPLPRTTDPFQDERQPTPSIPPERCPCQFHGHWSAAIPSTRIEQVRQTANSLHDDLFQAVALWRTNFGASSVALGKTDPLARSFLHSKDLLVFQILRC